MPELPEVETVVRDLERRIQGRKIVAVWFDAPNLIKLPKQPSAVERAVVGRRLVGFRRKGKNVLIDLDDGKTLLIHQKITGHLLVGKWQKIKSGWQAQAGPLADPINRFIHLVFTLDDGRMLALSDARKFAKVLVAPRAELEAMADLADIGPDPLSSSFSYQKFRALLARSSRKIKQVLMDQKVIAGIGNIYSDEILWLAKVHPFKSAKNLTERDWRAIWNAMHEVLREAVRLRGTSIDDFRDPEGRPGLYTERRRVYQREGEPCRRCGTKIVRKKIGGRSAHFCPKCQKL